MLPEFVRPRTVSSGHIRHIMAVDETMLIEAVIKIRLEHSDGKRATASELQAMLADSGVSATLSEVKKAASKASKRMASKALPAVTTDAAVSSRSVELNSTPEAFDMAIAMELDSDQRAAAAPKGSIIPDIPEKLPANATAEEKAERAAVMLERRKALPAVVA